jgi:hypothetical protein
VNYYDFRGCGVANYGALLTVTNSTISGNEANNGGGVANFFSRFPARSYGVLTVVNSTIAGNAASGFGGGVDNVGTLTVTNSTISGNTAAFGSGIANFDGTATVLNSTISSNAAAYSGGGVFNRFLSSGATLTLTRTLIAGNTAPTGPEIVNDSSPIATITADNNNLFGIDGTAGVEGFSPGATDIVPPAGVLLPDILDPTLAHRGGPTQTHALVPGSPAIDAGGLDCLDATGAPLATDQRGKPRVVDGDGDGTAACDTGAFEFFPIVNDFVTLDTDPETTFDPTPVPGSPAGTFTITATFTNTSDTPLRFPFFAVTELSGGNLVLNADEGTQGVGATRTPEVGDRVLAPGETVTVDFVIGLQARERFTFFVDLFGEPVR